MKIAIIKASDLIKNGCWSALQHTDSCCKCEKVLTCKIKNSKHEKGVEIKLKEDKEKLYNEVNERFKSFNKKQIKTLSLFK